MGAPSRSGLVNGCNRKVVWLASASGSKPQGQIKRWHRKLVDDA